MIQERFPIEAGDSVNSLAWKTTHLGADLLLRAIELIEAGNPPRQPQDPTGARYFSWPTPADVRRLRQRGRRYGSIFEDRPAPAARQSDVLAPQHSGSLRTRES